MVVDADQGTGSNKLRDLWRDLMTYTHSLPNLQEYLPRAVSRTPIYSTPNGLLGMYYTGENSKSTQRELSRIKAEEDYLWDKINSDLDYPAERYRGNKPKRISIKWNPERFISKVGSRLPGLINQEPYTANGLLSDSFREAQALALSLGLINLSGLNLADGSSFVYQLNPAAYSNVNPMEQMTATGEEVKPGQDINYIYPESYMPYPENWVRNVPLVDLREIFSKSEWPVIHQNWPKRSVVEVAYFPNTPGSQRMADYYGFKAMEDEARQEFLNTPPATMVMPRAIERPQIPYDPLVAGYLPLMQQEQQQPAQRPIRYERASGRIKELKRPARLQQNGLGE